MTSETFILLSGALTFGTPIAVAIRELLLLGPARRDGGDPPPELYPRPVRGPLPDCLLPPPAPPRQRTIVLVLEDA